jgi:V/A-type H+-transporting ATPase subunit A
VSDIVEPGKYRAEDTICVVEGKDGGIHELNMIQVWPVRTPRPFKQRIQAYEPLITGQRVLDTMFPLVRGGCAGVPGDFGTGKTIIQQQLAKWSDADVVIYVGCGERGNEMTDILREFPELEDPRTGRSLMERTVLIANTSNMPVAAREVSIYTGITMAEYYRDMGYDVALMADSTSRWAEALREMSSRLEEMPAEEGFPAYLSKRLAQFYERAGAVRTLGGDHGSVSIVGSVSPPGGDFSEPVTQHTTRFTRCFWVLDRELAYARHFPSVSWSESYSEYVEQSAEWWQKVDRDWFELRKEAMTVLQEYGELLEIVQLVGPDVLPDNQRLVLLTAEILKEGFLQQNAFHDVDSFCDPQRQAALLRAIITFYRRSRDVISQGAPVMEIRELSIVQSLKRARFTIENGDEEGLQKLHDNLNNELSQLEEKYR